jgi:hypothetical protein
MHGVAPHMCGQVGHPLLDRGAGGRSPGYLATVKANVARIKCPASESNSMTRRGTRSTLLARDRMMDFQKLADEAFSDLLKKHGRPTDLKTALRESVKNEHSK